MISSIFLIQLALKLSKRTKVKKAVVLKPLIDVVVTEIMADVVDRKWDTQGGVSMKEIAVMDYITPGKLYCFHSSL